MLIHKIKTVFGVSEIVLKLIFLTTSNIIAGTSNCKDKEGSCVSICDTSGQLLFYANTRPNLADIPHLYGQQRFINAKWRAYGRRMVS